MSEPQVSETGFTEDIVISLYRQHVARSIQAQSRQIAETWLSKLVPVVQEELADIFPTVEYLDHIPTMIEEIGTIVGSGNSNLALVNSVISRKALQLGALRHQQKASISQLLREYDILAIILEEHLSQATDTYDGVVDVADALGASELINSIIRQILQFTVDAFAERYMATIEDQTTRLASYNHLVGHEIRSSLNSALLGIEWVSESTSLDPEAHDEMQRIRSALVQAASVVNDIDDLVAVDSPAGRDDPVRQEVELAPLIEDLKTQLTEALDDSGVKLIIPDSLGALSIETGKLKLILTNLFSNAIKYSDRQKPERVIRVDRLDMDDVNVQISISDNGLGIPADKLDEVFKLRVRAHADLDDDHNVAGHGLGLYLVDEAVSELGGTIEIESEEGAGTTVRLRIPARSVSGSDDG